LNTLQFTFGRDCGMCKSIKPPNSHHCSTCGCCIARMDHHCPWVNNCVGYYNQKHFLLFLVYVGLASIYALVAIAKKQINCVDLESSSRRSRVVKPGCELYDERPNMFLLGILSMFLATLFALFVATMFVDQINCIREETSTIDKLKEKREIKSGQPLAPGSKAKKRKESWKNLNRVMTGSRDIGFNLTWLYPCSIRGKLLFEDEFI